jgi:gamma-glutamylcyclotransferase (GGCT)/AIG2-like uncharacterized protein YtfP
MDDLVFFYGTLMSGFRREGRTGVDDQLRSVGRGSIAAALFDLGLYPAAIPASDSRVTGEVHRMLDVSHVLAVLDEIEGYSASNPFTSLYTREHIEVTLDDGTVVNAWVYLYNAPLAGAPQILSGDYLGHLQRR